MERRSKKEERGKEEWRGGEKKEVRIEFEEMERKKGFMREGVIDFDLSTRHIVITERMYGTYFIILHYPFL